jgi:hypothetical protein
MQDFNLENFWFVVESPKLSRRFFVDYVKIEARCSSLLTVHSHPYIPPPPKHDHKPVWRKAIEAKDKARSKNKEFHWVKGVEAVHNLMLVT